MTKHNFMDLIMQN